MTDTRLAHGHRKVTYVIPEALATALAELAESEGRSVNAQVIQILRAAIYRPTRARKGREVPVAAGDKPHPFTGKIFHGMGDRYYEWSGEYREPQGGEFYISGSPPEVYRAFGDMKIKMHIAKVRER